MTAQIPNGASYTYLFYLVDVDDDETPEEAKSPTVYLCKNDESAFTATTNAATEIDEGFYKVVLTASELDTDGDLAVYATATGTDRWVDKVQVVTAPTGPYTVTISETQYENIADQVLRRTFANARASAVGDTLNKRSMLGVGAKLANRTKHNTTSSKLEVYQEDDTTLWFEDPVTTSESAASIVEVDPS